MMVNVDIYETADGILFLRSGSSDWVFEVDPNMNFNDACRDVYHSQPPYTIPEGMTAWGVNEKLHVLVNIIATWHGIGDFEYYSQNPQGESGRKFLKL